MGGCGYYFIRNRVVDGDINDRRLWRSPGFRQTDREPVVCVNWEDARAYTRWLSKKTGKRYRLLSEAEWEYAARGGKRTSYYWGEASWKECAHANGADRTFKKRYRNYPFKVASCRDDFVQTAPVGSISANGFGLHDIMGNVKKWVADCWNRNYRGAPADGSAWAGGDCSKRVTRGGSWHHGGRGGASLRDSPQVPSPHPVYV